MNEEKLRKEVEQLIDKQIEEDIIDYHLKSYYEKLSSNFGKFKQTYKEFKENIKSLIYEGLGEDRISIKILSDEYFWTDEFVCRLSNFLDNLNELSTNELLNYDKDNESFKEDYGYCDDDYVKETINEVFDDKDTFSEVCNNNSYNDYYMYIYNNFRIEFNDVVENVINSYNNYVDEEEQTDIDKELLDELIDKELDINLQELKKAFIYHYFDDVFNWFSSDKGFDDEIERLDNKIKSEISKELLSRKEKITKDIEKKQKEVLDYEKLLTNNNEELIDVAMNERKERLYNEVIKLQDEYKNIYEFCSNNIIENI